MIDHKKAIQKTEKRIDDLISQLTLEEKVSMCAGSSLWMSTGVKRLNIPAFKMTDGPNGARGEGKADVTSTCFPVGTALASTWNLDLIYRVGQALGEEALLKNAQVLLGPTINLHRTPLGGRNFECFSEDPYLTGKIGCAYIRGVQSKGVATAVKHFVCNDSEYQRHTISSEVPERVLREMYLLPFEMAVKEAATWSIMSSYNKINGVWASENKYLLSDVLKGEWGFDGYVVSDWAGHNDTLRCANAGLDLEMPGPARTMGKNLLKAAEDGLVEEATVDDKCRRLLRTLIRTDSLDRKEEDVNKERSEDRAEIRQLAREAAAESMVLLKNDSVLPLDQLSIKKIAVIGPNANVARIQGGGSAGVNPLYAVTPLEGIREKCGDQTQVEYALGCPNHKLLPLFDTKNLRPEGGDQGQGFKVEYFNNLEMEDQPVETRNIRHSEFFWFGEFSQQVNSGKFSARVSAILQVDHSGAYQISLASAGLSRLYIDEELIIDNWDEQQPGEIYFSQGSTEVIKEHALEEKREYQIRVEYTRRKAGFVAGLRLGMLPVVSVDQISEAVRLAETSDVAILCVGLNSEWDTEGNDRQNLALPGDQVKLIQAVANANKNTLVILNNGSSIEMGEWLNDVSAVLEAWYPGQECGNAIADILFGDVTPSGRLTQTFPHRLEDTPAYANYPGDNGKVIYAEGLFVGYRYFDAKAVNPLFPFGFGLSYTTFDYSDVRLDKDCYGIEDTVNLTMKLTNTGNRAGHEVVQLYIRDMEASVRRPVQELKGFQKVMLAPAASSNLKFTLHPRDFSFYDDLSAKWVVEPGLFEIRIGASSRDIRLSADCFITGVGAGSGAEE